MSSMGSLNQSLFLILLLTYDTAHVLECFWIVNFHSWLSWHTSSFVSLQNIALFLRFYEHALVRLIKWGMLIRRINWPRCTLYQNLGKPALREKWISYSFQTGYGYIRALSAVIESALMCKLKASVIHDRVGLVFNWHHINSVHALLEQ